jgi:hypothetical protein
MAHTMLPPPAEIGPRGVGGTVTCPVVHAEATRTVVTLRGETDLSTRAALADVLSRVIAAGNGDRCRRSRRGDVHRYRHRSLFGPGQQLLDRTGRALTFRSPSRVAVRVLDMFGMTELIEPPARPPSSSNSEPTLTRADDAKDQSGQGPTGNEGAPGSLDHRSGGHLLIRVVQ